MQRKTNLIVSVLLFFVSIHLSANQPPETLDSLAEKLTIGVKMSPPFTMKNEKGVFTGVSVDLWKNIAYELDFDYRFKEYNLIGLLDAIENNEVDICISPLTVTSGRLKRFDFTQPFYTSNLAIAIPKSKRSQVMLFFKNFFSLDFFRAVFILFLTILFFGFIIWLIERKHNPDQFERGVRGLGHGIWWSAVTMTTVGYGSKVPRTAGGRVVAMIWMFTAIIIISSLTGSIAASLTIQKSSLAISDINDLKDVKVATVKGSNSAKILMNRKIDFEGCDTIEKALQKVANGELDAFFYDEPIISYIVQKNQLYDKVLVVPQNFNSQYYSFSLPRDHNMLDTINIILIEKLESLDWKAILNEYNLEQ